MRTKLRILMIFVMIFCASGTYAQGKREGGREKPKSDSATTASASGKSFEELKKKGEAAVVGSDWKECVKCFNLASKIRPEEPILYLAIGRCSLEQGQNVSALRYLKKGMQMYSLSDQRRSKAENLVNRARQRLGRYQLKLVPENASVKISGQPLELDEDGYLWLDQGRYSVAIRASGYQPVDSEIEVAANDDRTLNYELKLKPEPMREAIPLNNEKKSESKPEPFPIVPAVITGTGGALLIASAVTGIAALSKKSKLEDKCRNNVCDPSLKSTKKGVDVLAVVTDVLWITGVVVVGAGLGLSPDTDSLLKVVSGLYKEADK